MKGVRCFPRNTYKKYHQPLRLLSRRERPDRHHRRRGAYLPLAYNERHELIRLTFPDGLHRDWRYDGRGRMVWARDVKGNVTTYAYDALGRRIRKTYAGTTTHFVWDGNVPLHEWTEENEVVTWLFEQDTFVPAAKLVANGECFSIVSDYLGTPIQAYDKNGEKVWEQELDIYGRQRKRPSAFIPFKYQGQYADEETGLYYNRFRYYDPNAGSYISQDLIGLAGGDNLYAYVPNPSSYIDIFRLSGQRWMIKTKKDGTPYKKPGPKTKGTGAHNEKIEEIIKRESAKPGVTHIGGGMEKTENIIN